MEKSIVMTHPEIIFKCGILKYIDKSEYISFLEEMDFTERTYRNNEVIYREGEPINSICLVASGSVRAERVYATGELHIVSIYEPPFVFALDIALSEKRTTPLDFVANEKTTIVTLSLSKIKVNEHRRLIRNALIEMLANDSIRTGHKIEILAEKRIRGRILIYLDIMARRYKSNRIAHRMNREQFAQYLCVNRSALSNELSKMKQEGILDYTKYEFHLLNYNEDGTARDASE